MALLGGFTSEPGGDPYNLDRYALEVQAGLPSEKRHLDGALENQAFYDRDADRYTPQREAETTWDYMGRPKRQSGITHEIVEVLCEHLYNPGPSRQFDDQAGAEFLERVWTDNLFDALMRRADALATLNDVCAIQVDAGEGNFAERPITLRLWGREEFHAWTHPSDATKPVAVVTIDRYDLQTTYRLWGKDEVRTYRTKPAKETSGGQVAVEVSREPNTYGEIPFGFVHYDLPVRRFYTPAPGTFVRKGEVRVNERLSILDESIQKHLNPIIVGDNLPLEWNPILEPGRILRTFSGGPLPGASGGIEMTPSGRIYFLAPTIDVAGAWADLLNFVNTVLEATGVPMSAVRMDQTSTASGIALVAEQAPLLTRARKRRGPFSHFEAQIARTILTCAGNHYGKPQLVTAAQKGRLALGWAEPTVPIPDPARDQLDQDAIAMGTKSVLMIVQERCDCSREAALEIVEQVLKDQRDLEKLQAKVNPPAPLVDPTDVEAGEDESEGEGPAGNEPDDPIDDSDDESVTQI